jgi:Flp pilus assembly protein TadD
VFVAAAFVLAFPYLAVREQSVASALQVRDPEAALSHLSTAARLNPFSADPGRLGGTIALNTDQFTEAQRRFRQAIDREPGGWFAWLGAGLAASALGETARARSDFQVAASINAQQPVIAQALKQVDTDHPLSAAEAFKALFPSS